MINLFSVLLAHRGIYIEMHMNIFCLLAWNDKDQKHVIMKLGNIAKFSVPSVSTVLLDLGLM